MVALFLNAAAALSRRASESTQRSERDFSGFRNHKKSARALCFDSRSDSSSPVMVNTAEIIVKEARISYGCPFIGGRIRSKGLCVREQRRVSRLAWKIPVPIGVDVVVDVAMVPHAHLHSDVLSPEEPWFA